MTSKLPPEYIASLSETFQEHATEIKRVFSGPNVLAYEPLLEKLMAEAQWKLARELGLEAPEKTGHRVFPAVWLAHGRYQALHTARGGAIKREIKSLIAAMNDAKMATSNGPAATGAALASAGVPAIVPVAEPGTPRMPPFWQQMDTAIEEALEASETGVMDEALFAAAEEGAAVTAVSTLGMVVIGLLIVVVILALIAYLLLKPANSFCLLLNISDKPLKFHKERVILGNDDKTVVTNNIEPVVRIQPNGVDMKTYVNAGFFDFFRAENGYGSQAGFSLHFDHTQVSVGLQCTLTDIFGNNPNACWVDIGASADHAARIVKDDGVLTTKKITKHGGSIICRGNSKKGAPAYFIAQFGNG